MDWEELGNTLRTRWATSMPAITTQYSNAPFDAPDSGVWARVSVLQGQSDVAHMGQSKRYRTPGTLVVSLYTDLEEGDGAALELVDPIFEFFRALHVEGIALSTPYLASVGRTEHWWHLNLTCPFFVDDFDP